MKKKPTAVEERIKRGERVSTIDAFNSGGYRKGDNSIKRNWNKRFPVKNKNNQNQNKER